MNNQQQKWLYFSLLSLVWGSSFILMKKALIGVTPNNAFFININELPQTKESKAKYNHFCC
jgi:hypothetical protein